MKKRRKINNLNNKKIWKISMIQCGDNLTTFYNFKKHRYQKPKVMKSQKNNQLTWSQLKKRKC